MGISEDATMVCAAGYDQVFRAAHQALAELGATVDHADPSTGAIRAKRPMSFSTWGENLTVQVGAVSATQSQVTMTSSLKFGLVDWGKNRKNLVALQESLQRQLAPPSAGAWHPDPSGRHEHRWHDGQQWSASVSDAGVTTTDPL